MQELVSVIVPIYNVEQYLERCVNSLINQTYRNIEIYLVDDGSTDNCPELCDKIKQQDERITVVHKENGGYGSVLEYAINHIKGKYFMICDSDDWFELDAVEKLMNEMIDKKVDIVIATKYVVCDGKKKNDESRYKIEEGVRYEEDLLKFVYANTAVHPKLYRTEIAKRIKFPKKVNHTDVILHYVFLSLAKSGAFIRDSLSNYFVDRPGNSTSELKEVTLNYVKSMITVINETINQIPDESSIKNAVIFGILGSMALSIIIKINNRDSEEWLECKDELFEIMMKLKKYRKYMSIGSNMIKFMLRKVFLSLFYFKPTKDMALRFVALVKQNCNTNTHIFL